MKLEMRKVATKEHYCWQYLPESKIDREVLSAAFGERLARLRVDMYSPDAKLRSWVESHSVGEDGICSAAVGVGTHWRSVSKFVVLLYLQLCPGEIIITAREIIRCQGSKTADCTQEFGEPVIGLKGWLIVIPAKRVSSQPYMRLAQ